MPTDTIDRNKIEAAIAAIAKRQIKQDFTQYEAHPSHIYTDAQGKMVFIKARYKNSQTGDKWIRSFHYDDAGRLKQKEPDYKKVYPDGGGKKPLYGLYEALQNADTTLYAVEGEHIVDRFKALYLVAVTAGGSSQNDSFDWSPFAGRNVVLWRDNDDAGIKWAVSLCKILAGLECNISVIDVEALGLAEKDDAIDYIERLYADGEDDGSIASTIKNLPTLTDKQIALLLSDDAGVTSTPIIANANSVAYEGGIICGLDDGVYFIKYDDDGEVRLKTFICSPLEVLARSRDVDSNSWGIVLQWHDRANHLHTWSMPIELLQSDSREYRRQLSSQGLVISTQRRAQQALDAYLNNYPIDNMATCVNQVGWYKDAYILPNITFNSGKQMVVYQPDKPSDVIYSQQGTLEQWTKEVCQPVGGQSRIAFAIACALSGQLLKLLEADSGGFHIVGGSSMGKSIGLKVAGSVWGNPDKFIKRWRVTDNGLESVAATHNDSFLGLDEISEGDPKSVGNSAYMLANGQGKVRAKAGGGNRPTATWRLMFLSNGEKTLNTYLRTAGIEVNAGQLVRLIHIEADAGLGYRSFDSLVLADTAEQQANIIKQRSTTFYGTAGIAWIDHITKDKQLASDTAKALRTQFMSDYSGVKEQAHRVAERFAIVAAAGEMATEAGITGWQAGQATAAVKTCFNNWLGNYGSDGNHEERQVIKQVQSFIEQHGSSRFQPWDVQAFYDNEPKINNRAGWRKPDDNLYLFYTNSFAQVCGSHEVKSVLQVLDDAGLLLTNEKPRHIYKIELPDAQTARSRLKDKRTRMYAIKGEILNYDVDENAGTGGTDGTTHTQQGLQRVPPHWDSVGQMGQNSDLSQLSQVPKKAGTAANPVNTGLSHLSQLSQAKTVGKVFNDDICDIPEGFLN